MVDLENRSKVVGPEDLENGRNVVGMVDLENGMETCYTRNAPPWH
jgi:hypothetical protein